MRWIACELHTHTVHSDGSQTLQELASGAVKLGFEAIALTDHNTMSGLAGKEDVARDNGLWILPGMEWTTFYGHMVTIGLEAYADWREADLHRIDEGIAAVHRLGGLAGLAHPFRIGSPACTGCYWEYEVGDWSAVDYIEVWSGTFPPIRTNNQRAFALWTDKLNEGYRIAATSGRDWHTQTENGEPVSVTYLGIAEDPYPRKDPVAEGIERQTVPDEKLMEQRLIHSLREGRASVTLGPLLLLMLECGDERFEIGSILSKDAQSDKNIVAHVSLDMTVRAGLWSLPDQSLKLLLRSDLGIEHKAECPYPGDSGITRYRLSVSEGTRKWLRAELWGSVRGAHTLIAFTNAIYFA